VTSSRPDVERLKMAAAYLQLSEWEHVREMSVTGLSFGRHFCKHILYTLAKELRRKFLQWWANSALAFPPFPVDILPRAKGRLTNICGYKLFQILRQQPIQGGDRGHLCLLADACTYLHMLCSKLNTFANSTMDSSDMTVVAKHLCSIHIWLRFLHQSFYSSCEPRPVGDRRC
jgi:hypothetical protein